MIADLCYVTKRDVDVDLIELGLQAAPGATHALLPTGQALCLARHFSSNPYGGGRSKGKVIPTGKKGEVECSYCLKS